eukprot:13432831-Alexandrium_andersonii.AAC.1
MPLSIGSALRQASDESSLTHLASLSSRTGPHACRFPSGALAREGWRSCGALVIQAAISSVLCGGAFPPDDFCVSRSAIVHRLTGLLHFPIP